MKTNVPALLLRGNRRPRLAATPTLITLLLFVLPGRAPTDEFGIPLSVSIKLEGRQPTLLWPGVLGQVFFIESRTNFTDVWKPAGVVNADGATASWTDPVPLDGSRFYRLGYQVPEITVPVVITHLSQLNGLGDLATASFASVRDRLQQMADGGAVSFPVPIPGLELFNDLPLSGSAIHLDDLQRTMVVSGSSSVRGQPVNVMFVGAWEDDTGPAKGFNLGIKFPDFQIGDWVSGLSGTALDDLDFDSSVLTLSSAPLDLNLGGFGGNVASFYGGPRLNVRPGLNINRLVNLAETPKLAQPLGLLGFTDLSVMLEGFLGIDPNALFQPGGPLGALDLNLRALLPVSQPPGFPQWLRPVERVLEFTTDPALRVRLLDILEATPDSQVTTFMASTEIDTSGGQPQVTLLAGLAQPWARPFGIDWLTFEQATVSLTFSQTGPAVIALVGGFAAGNQNITTEITLTETGQSNSASFVATVDQITLGDVLELFGNVTGSEPFGSGLPDNALVLSDVQFSFDSGDERSVAVAATSTILGTIQTDVLLSFVETSPNTTALILGLRVHDFRLSALFEGIDGTLAGDLEFPGVAFTIMQDLPNPPTEPIEISSAELNPTVRDFYEPILGTPPFVLEMKAGLNFDGEFPQSRLPPLVLDALGMDPDGIVLLEGGMNLRLGALTGGGLVALDSLNLRAVLPPPTRPRLGFPEWLGNLESGERILEFTYAAPDIAVAITDTFQADLDGARRTFVTSTSLATDGQQAELTLTGDMVGNWAQPFGIEWLTLNSIGFVFTGDGTTASASLHSSFPLGAKTIALEVGISGDASSQLVSFRGTVDSLSLSDFLELARNHLGAEADPFGDSTFNFTFTDVSLNIEAGARSSFSLGGHTVLNGKPTRCLFSAIPRPGGGLPQIITGFQFKDWSLADALPELDGTFVNDFEFDTSCLVFSKGEGTTHSDDMDPETRAFYGEVYESHSGGSGGGFSVPFHNGLGLVGTAPLQGNPLQGGLGALGASTDSLLMTGTLPGSILGLGGGGGLSGLSLTAGLPPISLPDAPDWFINGQVGLQITAQPSVGFVGAITVNIEGEILTFDVAAEIQRVGANVEFALTGGLAAQEPWVNPFGIEWLIFNNATVKVAVSAIGSVTLGFAGDMVIGEKDIDVAVAVTVSPAGVPTNFIFDGASEEGITMADLVALQQRMAKLNDPNAPMIPLSTMPDMAVRQMHLKFAPRGDPDLGVEAGFAIAGDLWVPSTANGPADRNFAEVNVSVDFGGIIAQGQLGAFELGPITWSDAMCDLQLTLPVQQFFVRGAAEVGSFFQGDLDLGLTRTGLSFVTTTTIYNQFDAVLTASATFSLDNPGFTVHGLLQNDFGASIVPSLTQKVKARANASIAVADDLLRRGLTGWTSFRSNPHALNFASRITGFAGAAEWDISQWQPFVNAIQKAMNDIDLASPSTPSALLDKALNGFTTAGIPGVKTTILGQDFCNGIPYGGGACWTVPPATIGGVCHDPVLSQFDIPCSATAFIEEKLIPPLASRIDNILDNQNRDPMIVIERAEFTSGLDGLLAAPQVTLATRIRFMQAATRLNLSSTWNFSNEDGSLNAMRDALVNVL